MVNRNEVVEKILAHLNGTLSEAELVHWAEDAFVSISESQTDLSDEALLLEILGYLGAGDSPGFPLSWSVLSRFLGQLGVRVCVVTEAA